VITLWFLIQSSIIFAVIASNIHWQWTPNTYLAGLIGAALAYGVTVVLGYTGQPACSPRSGVQQTTFYKFCCVCQKTRPPSRDFFDRPRHPVSGAPATRSSDVNWQKPGAAGAAPRSAP
jgi:hypothetical protein